jgi:hypothetical protein
VNPCRYSSVVHSFRAFEANRNKTTVCSHLSDQPEIRKSDY